MGEDEIRRILPHRYPFLFVDRILEWGERRVRALKNVTGNEPFFQGHFPERPIMPGVLILEGMAQTVGLLVSRERPGRYGYLVGVDRARFRRPVHPGDQLIYEAELKRSREGFYRAWACATVHGTIVAEALLSIAITPETSE
ncbi:MAG: 3-hydroxyacyl-ACP dehydratase FabZ [Candidatus Bipolaricaulota bacterium]|nr:3-hydroxyacyl-ACP dehydratase FabZ [Candidatus Bipolaricaulota bacterium]MDW8031450.1 3-hydroxyacyl-ACP dehydratase FabZ [Candidatus Bipolaricaulota bacterium]